jgi:hypothetical protein
MDTKSIINKSIGSLFIIVSFLFSSCSFEDNYEGPNANFHGALIDVNSNNPISSEQPNGFQIQYRELSWGPDAASQKFEGKPDGTFNFDYVFGYTDKKYDGSNFGVATYEVQPINGAFVMVGQDKDTIEVLPNQRVEVNFKVNPYIVLKLISSTLSDTTLTVTYSMSRPVFQTSKISASAVVISSRTKFLSASLNAGGWEDKYTARKQAPNLITYADNTVITETIKLNHGKTYWVRLAAKSSKTTFWNYTETTELVVP